MSESRYAKLQALVVDDFDNFRKTLRGMLNEFGIATVDVAATSEEALHQCRMRAYDLILCDQNLGKGKTGQHILEVLRSKANPNSDALFVLVSAESNKSIIMAAYDCEPDDYLTKPISAHALEQRLSRLLTQRFVLAPIYKAIKENNRQTAIDLCRAEIDNGTRYKNHCQKMLGHLLLEDQRFKDAEALYQEILNERRLDWAMLGMALAKKHQDDLEGAQKCVEETIESNPLCLKAYDVLADIHDANGNRQEQQKILQTAVELSPLSILRQQALGDVALKNNDVVNSVLALRRAVKLGENSCHDTMDSHIKFAHASIKLSKIDKNTAKIVVRDAVKAVSELAAHFGNTNDNKVRGLLLESQLHCAVNDEPRSRECLLAAQKIIDFKEDAISVDSQVECVNSLRALGDNQAADRLTRDLLSKHAKNEEALQKIDVLLEEPRSEKNRAMVSKANKDGIAYYEEKKYARSVDFFNTALLNLPQHVGLRLNLLQALIELIKQEPHNKHAIQMVNQTLAYVEQTMPKDHAQYRRFRQLEGAWNTVNQDISNEKQADV